MRQLRMALTLGVLAAMLGACGGSARQPGAAVAPPATASPPPVPPMFDAERPITVCVVQDGELRMAQARYETRTGDTLVDGRPFAAVYADTIGYAAGAEWYVSGEYITINRGRYVKYGLPREIFPHELLTRAGEYRGVPLFAEKGKVVAETGREQMPDIRYGSDIRYVPVRPGCEFQPYRNNADVGAVRG